MKKLLLPMLICLVITNTQAQEKISSFHAGIFTGISYYSGDLMEKPIDQIAESHPSFGLFLRYNYGDYLSARANIFYGRVSGSDANADDVTRRTRNLTFRSPIFEIGVTPEFNIYDFVLAKSGYVITPYIYAGVAGFWYNPQAPLEKEWVDLQPQGTEGQGLAGNDDMYSRFGFAVPFGIGVKFKLSELASIGWEVGARFTNTDYIDDLGGYYPDLDVLAEARGLKAVTLSDRTPEYTGLPSTRSEGDLRASSQSNDYYMFTGLSLSINLAPRSAIKP
jgi:hypothetical protein